MRLFGIQLYIALCLLALSTVSLADTFSTQPQVEKVRSFLAQQKVIRIGISRAPGNGHQSAGATVITRLRELGYGGLIEVVYEEVIAEKLEYLIPPFLKTEGPYQYLPSKNVVFIRDGYQRQFMNSEVELGIMGADDYKWEPENLNVRALLTLQPLDWADGRLQILGDKDETLEGLKPLGFVFHPPQTDDPAEFLKEEMSHVQSLEQKISGLTALLQARNRNELAAVYGHRVEEGWQLLLYLRGLVRALKWNQSLFQGGIVVPVLSDISVDRWEDIKEEIEVLWDAGTVKALSIHELRESHIQDLQPGQVLAVNVGPVSKRLFEYLYSISTVAPVVEGKNSANFMQLLGFPYLPSLSRESFHFDARIQGTRVEGGEIAQAAAEALWTRNYKEKEDAAAAEDLARFIVAAKDRRSQVRKLFRQFQAQLDSVAHDKVIQGLLLVIDRLQRVPTIAEEACMLSLQ